MKRALSLAVALAFGLAIFSAMACPQAPKETTRRVHDGPIVLITIDALRADAIGALTENGSLATGWSATPALDRFVEQARDGGWAGPAIASSSWTVPATASLLTGLSPWQHQALRAATAELRSDLTTLPEALHKLGWRTSGYTSGYWQKKRFGYSQGFDFFRGFGKGHHALGHLGSLDARREFVWIHLDTPAPPFDRLTEGRLAELRIASDHLASSTERLTIRDLEPYFAPDRSIPSEVRSDLRALYLSALVVLDDQIASLLDAVRASGRWDETIIAIVGTHAEALGEGGHVLDGGQLGRETIEVPLVIKLPTNAEATGRLGSDERPACLRLWATLIELAGGQPSPAVAPSLLRSAAVPKLSELYFVGGVNQISLVEDDVRLLATSRFLPETERFYDARLAGAGVDVSPPLPDSPERLFRRWGRIFERTAPLSSRPEATTWSLERWTRDGPVDLDDPDRTEAMAERLLRAWGAGNERQLPPARHRTRESGAGI